MGLCPPRVMNVLLWTEAAPTWKLCSLVWGRVGPEGALFFLMYTKTSHKLALNLLSNALDTTSSRDSNNQHCSWRQKPEVGSMAHCLSYASLASWQPARSFLSTYNTLPVTGPTVSSLASGSAPLWASSISFSVWTRSSLLLHCASFLERLLHWFYDQMADFPWAL